MIIQMYDGGEFVICGGNVKESATSAAMCPICNHRHSLRDPHIWDTVSHSVGTVPAGAKITTTSSQCVHNTPKKANVYTDKPKPDDIVYTTRRVSIRQLRANLATELIDLPFEIIKNGVVIARVIGS